MYLKRPNLACRKLHKTAKPWYKWMTRQELKELREARMAEQKAASAATNLKVDENGTKAAEVAVKDIPEVVVSNGLVVPDIGKSWRLICPQRKFDHFNKS